MRGILGPAIASAIFFVIAPGTVAGLVPWWICRWRFEAPFFGWPGFRLIGALLIGAVLVVLIDSFARFATLGRGTPAPPLPTERLVISGFYRHVRNPMYLAVLSIIVGQAMLFGSVPLLAYAALVWLVFHSFVLIYEEPTLRKRYGAEYDAYCAGVDRWWPRLRPWRA